jgi:hypothetical protein
LWIELELMGQNLAKGFGASVPTAFSARRVYDILADNGDITRSQFALVESILKVANAAVHGADVSREEADSVIDSAAVLRDQYLDWLSWGFQDDC